MNKSLTHLCEDILNATIVQLNDANLSTQVHISSESMVFSVLVSGSFKHHVVEFTLNFKEIQALEHQDIGRWLIHRHKGEPLLLQCYSLTKSGIPFFNTLHVKHPQGAMHETH